jgi:hypothetical protein
VRAQGLSVLFLRFCHLQRRPVDPDTLGFVARSFCARAVCDLFRHRRFRWWERKSTWSGQPDWHNHVLRRFYGDLFLGPSYLGAEWDRRRIVHAASLRGKRDSSHHLDVHEHRWELRRLHFGNTRSACPISSQDCHDSDLVAGSFGRWLPCGPCGGFWHSFGPIRSNAHWFGVNLLRYNDRRTFTARN